MRVIAGCARGVRLSSLDGDKTRPIQDRTKGAIFNILSNVIPDSSVIDLYAGTGAIGIEALSRGANACVFVEVNKSAIQVVEKNIVAVKLQDKASVLKCDVFECISYLEKNGVKADIVFASPPYPLVEEIPYKNRLLGLFLALCDKCIIQPGGIIIFQHRKADLKIPVEFSGLDLWDSRVYGDTQFSFLKSR